MKLFCCACNNIVNVRLTDGKEIYPHSPKLFELPFYRCDKCKNYVGCHHKTKDRTKPLGNIPDAPMRNARQHIHKILDPLWKLYKEPYRARHWIYKWLAYKINKEEYHTAEIKTIDEARQIYRLVLTIENIEDCKNDIIN